MKPSMYYYRMFTDSSNLLTGHPSRKEKTLDGVRAALHMQCSVTGHNCTWQDKQADRLIDTLYASLHFVSTSNHHASSRVVKTAQATKVVRLPQYPIWLLGETHIRPVKCLAAMPHPIVAVGQLRIMPASRPPDSIRFELRTYCQTVSGWAGMASVSHHLTVLLMRFS